VVSANDADEWRRFDRLPPAVRRALAAACYQWYLGPVTAARMEAMTTEEAVRFIETHDRAFANTHAVVASEDGAAEGAVQE
jgi:Family of unknown function (DUF6525)